MGHHLVLMSNARRPATHRAFASTGSQRKSGPSTLSVPSLLRASVCHACLTCGRVTQVVRELGGAGGSKRGFGSRAATSPLPAAVFLPSLSPCCNLYPLNLYTSCTRNVLFLSRAAAGAGSAPVPDEASPVTAPRRRGKAPASGTGPLQSRGQGGPVPART